MNYSPLRYPGGKGKITPLVNILINQLGKQHNTYVEPFAGGAGVALALLLENKVDKIVINDYDKAIYSFWRAIVKDTQLLLEKIQDTPVTIDEWYKQKEIYTNCNKKYSVELAFATFFLNRTNRSGILKAGPIGGYLQNSNYSIDARYNKEKLIKRIELISSRKKDIKVYNKEILNFIKYVIPQYSENTFIYFDPPYFNKGHELYKNFFEKSDHIKIKNSIVNNVKCNWIVTYDDTKEILDIYNDYTIKRFDLNYSVANNRKSSEIIIFKNNNLCPSIELLRKNKISLNLR